MGAYFAPPLGWMQIGFCKPNRYSFSETYLMERKTLMNYRVFLFLLVGVLPLNSMAFEYNTEMVEFNGGVISQLNNCGARYTASGRLIWGLTSQGPQLQSNDETITELYSVSDGVVAIIESGEAFFSPDGKNLSGGGSTRSLGKYDSVKAFDDRIFLLNRTSRRSAVRGIGGTTYTMSKYRVIHNPGKASETETNIEIERADKVQYDILGIANDQIYLREYTYSEPVNPRGSPTIELLNIISVANLNDLLSESGTYKVVHTVERSAPVRGTGRSILNPVVHSRISTVEEVIPYNGGVLAYGEKWVYVSRDTDALFEGSGVTQIYDGDQKISSLLNRGGETSVDGYELGITTTYKDGRSYFSPDGLSLNGGGNTTQFTAPVSGDSVTGMLSNYVKTVTGNTVTVNKTTWAILNRGQTADFAEGFFVGSSNSNGYGKVVGFASTFDGGAAEVRLYDKGWDGWEFKWRDRGTVEGVVDIETSQKSIIGDTGIRIRAEKGCVLFAGAETISQEVEPIEFSWNVAPDGSFVNPSVDFGGAISLFKVWEILTDQETEVGSIQPKSIYELILAILYEVKWERVDFWQSPSTGVNME